MKILTFVRRDTQPQRLVLEVDVDGAWQAVDLTGGSCRLLLAGDDGAAYVGTAAIVSPATAGQVDALPPATAPSGGYRLEVEVTFAGGLIQTFPTALPGRLRIREDLG